MGTLDVDQIGQDAALIQDVDTTLTEVEKNNLLLSALPGATLERYAGVRALRFGDQIIFKKQVTHLGFPHAEFKKRIQIPNSWVAAHQQAIADGLQPRFVGIYNYGEVTIFVDYDTRTYVLRKLHNSSAWVYTNDLFQAQTLGQFSREDKNGNRITSIRADQFAAYLHRGYDEKNPHIEILDRFSDVMLDGAKLEGLAAVQEMHAANWPDTFFGEWAGAYLEYRLNSYLRMNDLTRLMRLQKEKRRGGFDYDLQLLDSGALLYYGDLKASNVEAKEAPGNDAVDFFRCLKEFGRFWYVIYEHETWHGKHNDHLSTMAWNEWKESVGYFLRAKKAYDQLSYATRYKEAVRFVTVKVLEVNQANAGVVLAEFQKDFRQPDGKPRKAKVSIKKKDIDNFLIYTKTIEASATAEEPSP